MNEIIIDCGTIETKADFHAALAAALSFPAYYGNNLDALHDCLTSLTGKVRLENWETAEEALGRYGLAARKAITAAALENTALELIL